MEYVIGIDVACKESALSAIDSQGKEAHHGSCVTKPENIHRWLQRRKIDVQCIAIETGVECHFLARELGKLGYKVEIVDARKSSKIMSGFHRNKTDRNDAFALAQVVRTNLHNTVRAKSNHQLDRISVCSIRRSLVETRVGMANAVRSLLKVRGIKQPGPFKTQPWKELVHKDSRVSEMLKQPALAMIAALEEVEKQIAVLDAQIKATVDSDPICRRLMTVPGVGPLLSFTFMAHIDPDQEFKRSRDIGAFLGMTPREYSSGEKTWRGRVSKCGSSELRKLLMQGGMSVIVNVKKRYSIKRWGAQLSHRKGVRLASMAVGRKLAVIMYSMMRSGQEFIDEQYEQEIKSAA